MIPALVAVGVACLVAFFAVSGFLFRALMRLDKGQVRLETQQEAMAAQYVRNGGSSLRDVVDRIERKVDDAATKVAENGTVLNAHLVEAARRDERLSAHIAGHP